MQRSTLDEDLARELLRRVARRDEAAMRALYRSFNDPVRRRAWQRLRHDADVDEAVNSTFAAVWKEAAGFEGRSKVSTWILGIADFQALMLLRQRGQRPDWVDIDALELAHGGDAWGRSGERHLESSQAGAAVRHCLSALPPHDREIVILRLLLGLKESEAAVTARLPLGTVKSRFHGAVKRMRDCLDGAGWSGAVPA